MEPTDDGDRQGPRGGSASRWLTPWSSSTACCFSALRDAQQAGLRTVSLMHTFHAYFDGPWQRGPIGLLAKLKGLNPRGRCGRAATLRARLHRSVARSRRIEGLARSRSLDRPDPAAHRAIRSRQPTRVLASLSTYRSPASAKRSRASSMVWQTHLSRWCSRRDHRWTERADRAGQRRGARVRAPRQGDGGCSAVIGHGGHSTTVRASLTACPSSSCPSTRCSSSPWSARPWRRPEQGCRSVDLLACADPIRAPGRLAETHRQGHHVRCPLAWGPMAPPSRPIASWRCTRTGQPVTTPKASSTRVGLSKGSQGMRGSLRNSRS